MKSVLCHNILDLFSITLGGEWVYAYVSLSQIKWTKPNDHFYLYPSQKVLEYIQVNGYKDNAFWWHLQIFWQFSFIFLIHIGDQVSSWPAPLPMLHNGSGTAKFPRAKIHIIIDSSNLFAIKSTNEARFSFDIVHLIMVRRTKMRAAKLFHALFVELSILP